MNMFSFPNYIKFGVIFSFLASVGCQSQTKPVEQETAETDTIGVVAEAAAELPRLTGCDSLTLPAQAYASLVDDKASLRTLSKVDSLISRDMSDLREKAQVVYYPFSGPDFLYPYTLFPDADTYILLGLENTGSPLRDLTSDTTRVAKDIVKAYANTLRVYLHSSFFRTNSMRNDLASHTIDGTVPVLEMLMAKSGCEILSVTYKKIDAEGVMTDAEKQTRMVEIRFFRTSTPTHEQRLYYFSCNAADSGLPGSLHKYLNQSLEGKSVVTFLKAASYLMHKSYFSKIRNSILDHSYAVLQDDSGIPYRYFEGWDITLYGKYRRPLRLFAELTYQPELDSLYEAPTVRPLNFRIGYNDPSNWMVARKAR